MLVKGIRYARKCSECGRGMNEGYVIGGGCEHYCSNYCLHKHVTHEEFLELYDDGEGDSYYTEWEDQNDWDDDDGEEEALRVAITRDYQMVRDAAPDLLAALIELQQMVEAGENNEGTHEIVRNAIAKAKGQDR
jgi:hypothetical protein